MTRHKHSHDVGRGVKAVQHGKAQAIGPMVNARHPRKLKLAPINEKTPVGAANTDEGKAEKVLEGSDSASTITENGGFVK